MTCSTVSCRAASALSALTVAAWLLAAPGVVLAEDDMMPMNRQVPGAMEHGGMGGPMGMEPGRMGGGGAGADPAATGGMAPAGSPSGPPPSCPPGTTLQMDAGGRHSCK